MESSKEFQDTLENAFTLARFPEVVVELNGRYEALGLGTSLSDDERISEYWWITQQFRKYINGKKTTLVNMKKDPAMLLRTIESFIEESSESPKDRKYFMYTMLRDEWLLSMRNLVSMEMDNMIGMEGGLDEI